MVKHLTIHLTNRCNLKCANCHVAALENNLATEYMIPDSDIRKLFVSSLISISIAGGEPFANKKRLYHMLDLIPSHIHKAITSNATLINDNDLLYLKNNNIRLQVSIDGTKYYHEQNRGVGTYDLAHEVISKAIKGGIRVDILSTVTRDNMHDIERLVNDMNRLGVSDIMLLHFTPKGRGEQHPEDEMKREEWIPYIYNLSQKLTHIKKSRVWIQPRFLSVEQIQNKSLGRRFQCNYYRLDYAYVDITSGSIYPCGLAYDTPLSLGSLLENPSLDYLVSTHLASIGNHKMCPDCSISDICNGGAKCYSWLHFNDIYTKDPHCYKDNIIPVCPFPAMQIAGPIIKTTAPTIV